MSYIVFPMTASFKFPQGSQTSQAFFILEAKGTVVPIRVLTSDSISAMISLLGIVPRRCCREIKVGIAFDSDSFSGWVV